MSSNILLIFIRLTQRGPEQWKTWRLLFKFVDSWYLFYLWLQPTPVSTQILTKYPQQSQIFCGIRSNCLDYKSVNYDCPKAVTHKLQVLRLIIYICMYICVNYICMYIRKEIYSTSITKNWWSSWCVVFMYIFTLIY